MVYNACPPTNNYIRKHVLPLYLKYRGQMGKDTLRRPLAERAREARDALTINYSQALDFWQACGQPAIIWIPATHATIWLWYPVIRRKIVAFLSSTFGDNVDAEHED